MLQKIKFNQMKLLFTYIAVLCSFMLKAQQTPAQKQTKDFAIVGATAHIGNGTVIENSIIVVRNGKIDAIDSANKLELNLANIDVVDAKGKHVYPGFIIPNSTLGLTEIDAVKASDDESELGSWNPHIRSLIAYNAESKVVESMRPNGVLLGQITPRSGRISGTSSVVQFDAWNWEDAAVKVDDGIHVNWPESFVRGRWWLGEDPALKPNEKYAEQVTELTNYINNSKAYNTGDKTKTNLPFEAMNGLYVGSQKLYVHVDYENGILDAITFSKTHNINMVIVGGREAYKVANKLKENNIAVLLTRVHSRPNSDYEDYDLPFKSAKLLVDNGVLVALEASGGMERMNSRNLPFYAGTTAAYGLTKEQALQLITLNAAQILGIDKHYGSLTQGKSATLFISEGDALDMKTNRISHAFIDGRNISLETHQTKLWQRYSEKFKNQ